MKFPSPLGVSYFQIQSSLSFPQILFLLFPSPLGVSYFQIVHIDFNAHPSLIEFPSPLGVSYFQMVENSNSMKCLAVKKFPSPLGVSYFQINGNEQQRSNNKCCRSFRPLSGYLISKLIKTVKEDNIPIKKFPSPLGVSYFQITIKHTKPFSLHQFPSPLGVSYFQIIVIQIDYG